MNAWLHEPIWFTPPDGSGHGLWKSSSSPPPAPDYVGAAQATGASNLENIRAQTQANRYDTTTPYGAQTWQQPDPTGSPDKWANDITLAPQAQQTLDSQLALSNQMGQLGLDRSSAVNDAFSQPYDTGSIKDIADKSYSNFTSRLDPQWQANGAQLDSKLANQGIMSGSHAYDDAQRVFGQQKNDAYTQANQAAINTMPQTQQLAAALRNQPLNELNAIRTGAQIQNPQFGATPSAGTAPGTNYLGAAQGDAAYDQGLYNSQVGSANSFNSGLMTLVGAGATAF